jgi:hypothetical protein
MRQRFVHAQHPLAGAGIDEGIVRLPRRVPLGILQRPHIHAQVVQGQVERHSTLFAEIVPWSWLPHFMPRRIQAPQAGLQRLRSASCI